MRGNTGDVGEVREAGEVGEAGEAQREDSWRRPLLGSRGNGRAHKRRGRLLQWVGGVAVNSSGPGARAGERPATHDDDQEGGGFFYRRAERPGALPAGLDRSSRRGLAGSPGLPP